MGQNFAKAFNVQFVDKNNKLDYVWATSWGVSTRLMGALMSTGFDYARMALILAVLEKRAGFYFSNLDKLPNVFYACCCMSAA